MKSTLKYKIRVITSNQDIHSINVLKNRCFKLATLEPLNLNNCLKIIFKMLIN